ncbi:condensation domain-containing protein [Marilutibacter maris]|uniref:Condensation domain-containing protein n=1 Tax=Marilutibacter maris TaxID=1605891 RepID=A0A2U9T6F6_9GAMM|nr:condensation domain-containing protein [Lysobacter maris]AWV06078.1 hypothetical protein C9I47_0353 [Lysobacter maris]
MSASTAAPPATAAATARPLTLFERGMYLDGRSPVAIVFPARIRGPLCERRLRHALARVQAKHPLLRCRVEPGEDGAGGTRPWFRLQEDPAPIRLRIIERNSGGDWQRRSRQEWSQLFDPSEPLVRVTWLRGVETSELLLVCHHCLCDGRSIVTLLREILSLCADPRRDIGTHPSLQSLQEILPAAVWNDPRLQRRLRWKTALFGLFVRSRRRRPARRYGEAYALHWTLDRGSAQALSRRCRAEGVSLFNALAVAFVLGFRAVRGARGVGRFTVPVDARRFLPALAADGLFPMAPTIDLSLHTPSGGMFPDEVFWSLARTLRAGIDRSIQRLGPRLHENLLGMERLHALFDRLIAYGQSRPSGGNVTLSWLGHLDLPRDHGDFRLEAVHSPTAMLAPTPATVVTISGFDGHLDFALTSDRQSLPAAQAHAVRDRIVAILLAVAADADAHSRDAGPRPRTDIDPVPVDATATETGA